MTVNEILAYMPGAVASTIHNTASPNLDPTSPQYTHAYFVDATAATGDVFYGTHWHTWLVGGLGAGAMPGIYALDVTDPSTFGDSTKVLGTVIGEWTPSGIPGGCAGTNGSTCGNSMGNISGVPQIRRFHDGKWGVIFGNGINSASGDAGIFIMLLDQTSGKPSFWYLSTKTGSTATPNGIVSASAADIDGDHIVDFVYAGDLLGNVWRFNLTDTNESNWGTSQYSPIFKEPNGLPITTKIAVSTLRKINLTGGYNPSTATREGERVILGFGTGRMIPQTPTAATQYAAGPHFIYGIWDADMCVWNNPINNVQVVQPVTYPSPKVPRSLPSSSHQRIWRRSDQSRRSPRPSRRAAIGRSRRLAFAGRPTRPTRRLTPCPTGTPRPTVRRLVTTRWVGSCRCPGVAERTPRWMSRSYSIPLFQRTGSS